MFGLAMLDVAIGIIFVYLLLSLLVTAGNELIAAVTKWRAKDLQKGIFNLLKDKATEIYKHPLIKALSLEGKIPSYIPSRTFVLALLDILVPAKANAPRTTQDVENAIGAIPNPDVKMALTALLEEAGHDVKKLEDKIETWFNDTMDRVAGWYKRRTQLITVVLAVLVAGGLNADTILIAKSLSNDPGLRAAFVAKAQAFAQQQAKAPAKPKPEEPAKPTSPSDEAEIAEKNFTESLEKIQQLGIPIGWIWDVNDHRCKTTKPDGSPKADDSPDPRCAPARESMRDIGPWLYKFFGLLLTAVAASLGAPFWFDVLNKVINIRSAGQAPEGKPKAPKVEDESAKTKA